MADSRSKKSSVFLKPASRLGRAISLFLFPLFIINANAQSDATLVVKGETSVKSRVKDGGKGINVGVTNVNYKEEALEGAVIELKKNGATIATTTSGKKGKYSFEVPVSAADAKNDYVVYISKDGMGTKMVNINGYVSKAEFAKYPPSPKYDVELDVFLIPTTVKDAVADKPTAKIKWDLGKEHKFVVDPGYARVAQSEELKILGDPDTYYGALAKKRKKVEDALANKNAAADAKAKAAEEAKRKAEEEARMLAERKAKEEADRLARVKAEEERKVMLAKRIADSLAAADARKKALEMANSNANAKLDIKKVVRPVEENGYAGKDQYDAAETFSINIAKRSLNAEKEKKSREKGKNLSAKYETINVLTSLLNEADDYDKKHRD